MAPAATLGALGRLAGRWVGSEILHSLSGVEPERKAQGCFSNRIFEARFLINDYEQSVDGEIVFRGHGVYGFDPGSGRYSMYWIDSQGGAVGPIVAGDLEANRLVFLRQGAGGATRYAYTFEGPGGFRFELSVSLDGRTFRPVLAGRYEKR